MRPIILLTMPHTGTHTLLYLLNVLGDAETYHCHVAKPDKQRLARLFNQDLSDAVIIYTHRNYYEHEVSWLDRYKTLVDLQDHYKVHDWVMGVLDKSDWRVFHLNIDESRHHRHSVIGMACLEAEVPYTPEMQAFVDLWPKTNARSGEELVHTEESANKLTRAKRSRIDNYLENYHEEK